MVSDWTRWQRRNRRYHGVSFAVSHFIHLAALIALARLDQELFDPVTPKSVKEKLQAAAPAGSVVRQYKNMHELKPAFENGNNLKWIQHELQSLPSK